MKNTTILLSASRVNLLNPDQELMMIRGLMSLSTLFK